MRSTRSSTVNSPWIRTAKTGALAGDASVRGVIARLRSEISKVGGIGVGFKFISDIGVKFQNDGSLKLDETALADALDEDPQGVEALFTLANNGIGKRIPDAVDDYISTLDGALTFRRNPVQHRGHRQKVAREGPDRSLQERLTLQFSPWKVGEPTQIPGRLSDQQLTHSKR
jgi:flagellar hook-associated protein 2